MKIGLVGCGTIGGALKNWVEKNTMNTVAVYDPPKGIEESFANVGAIFICVPADTLANRGQNLYAIDEAISKFKDLKVPFFVRSTVLPGTCDLFSQAYEVDVYFCPEFLTARMADEDFAKHPVIVGTPPVQFSKLVNLLLEIFPGKDLHVMKNVEAEITKYTHNCFGAVKVMYFNLIYALCQKLNADYETVVKGAQVTGFIGPQWTKVPGPDSKFGFGGHCLPKDLKAFIGYLTDNQIPNSFLRRVESENNLFRDFRMGLPDETMLHS